MRTIIAVLILVLGAVCFGFDVNEKSAKPKPSAQMFLDDIGSQYTLSSIDWRNERLADASFESNSGSDLFKEKNYKDPKLAFGLSFLVPGTGEMYDGSYVKGAIFLAVEAGLWTGYYLFDSKGKDMRSDYEAYQRRHFDVSDYLNWFKVVTEDFSNTDRGTEQLPVMDTTYWVVTGTDSTLVTTKQYDAAHVIRNHDYYEMTGKYPWFLLGWDDAPAHLQDNPDLWDPSNRDQELLDTLYAYFDSSAHRVEYMQMRKDANDKFIWAKYMLGAALFNHVISAFDAAWTATRHNDAENKGFSDRIHMETRFALNKNTGELIPELRLVADLK